MKKVAFLVLAHSDPKHFKELVQALDNDGCDIYVHLDTKAEMSHFSDGLKNRNVFFLKERLYVSWTGFSTIEAEMLLIRECLQQKEKYTHAVLLFGSCFPIKKVSDIIRFLTDRPNTQFLSFIDMRESPSHYMKLINRMWFRDDLFKSRNKHVRLIDKVLRYGLTRLRLKNHWPKDIVPYFGSQWLGLTIEASEFVYKRHINDHEFRKMNIFTFTGDEHYIHTIIGNSHFNKNGEYLKPFTHVSTSYLVELHMIDPYLVKWFTIDDWEEVKKSDKFFLRKIRSTDGSGLVEKIKSEILYN